ncbi:hypothetical protein [Kocuria sp. SM24M-10]|uniref:hypothetical protein n=1 Tax=Kocuria sp. SM24M-10 TaxID=1660349 RepID=UPI000649DF1A|nr:hypothetical protein [Kocuria sp. SM24M-10]KLU09088.1 hypothetical protein ABL57_14175 [Kocuria sp. SM24M-10]
MNQQVQHGSTQQRTEPGTGRPATLETTGPVHCGRPMPVRPLDLADLDGRANHAAAQAAVDGRRLHACTCGFLLETEDPAGTGAPLVARGDEHLFHPFFTRRVLAAAGRAETAEWTLDQQLAEDDTSEGCESAARHVWLLDAGAETAQWELDRAVDALHAELRLAARHGVPLAALSEAAGLDEESVLAALRHDGAPSVPVGEDRRGPRAAAPSTGVTELRTQGHRASAEAQQVGALAAAG